MIPVLADAIHLLANKRSPWRRRWRKVGEEKPPARGVSRPWSFLAGTKQRRQVRKQCAATTLIEFVSFSRGAASPFWNASSPRPAFPARTTEWEREKGRKGEKRKKGGADIRPWNIDEESVNQWSRSKYRKFYKREKRTRVCVTPPWIWTTDSSSTF